MRAPSRNGRGFLAHGPSPPKLEVIGLSVESGGWCQRALDSGFESLDDNRLNVCPGLTLMYSIPLGEAARLDDRHELGAFIAARFAEVERALELHR